MEHILCVLNGSENARPRGAKFQFPNDVDRKEAHISKFEQRLFA